MPKRTRSHELEDMCRRRLRDLFGKLGWVVWDLYPDYGEDLLVRIFLDGTATHYSFFVQAKATEHIERYMSKDRKYVNFPIDIDHLDHWGQFWEPVVLTVWDATLDITYWEIAQDCLLVNDSDRPRKKRRINIPTTSTLDSTGLQNIFERTRLRYQRFELTCEGANALAALVEKKLNAQVVYEPGDDSIGIFYYSEDKKERLGMDLIALGDFAVKAAEAAKITGLTLQQIFEQAIDDFIKENHPKYTKVDQ